MKEWNE